ncbi:hypothetical protein AB0A98_06570 [Streptomyces chrestomyceticus]|uniref:hypothetical protein n=1 Tax=Streptomyces chrestomyceticus TaxID=68185 RepID=UPI0033D9BD30
MRTVMRRAATAAVTGALLFGGVIATASTASAAPGKGSCTAKPPAIDVHTYAEESVRFRTGPGTRYTATGLLTKGTKVYQMCTRGTWSYVQVMSGPHKYKMGWVSGTALAIHMQLD